MWRFEDRARVTRRRVPAYSRSTGTIRLLEREPPVPRKRPIHPGAFAPLLLGLGASALAASESAHPGYLLEPRYSIEGARFRTGSSRPSTDGRFTLELRLQREDAMQTGSGIALKAKLVATATAACDASGSIFSDSFE